MSLLLLYTKLINILFAPLELEQFLTLGVFCFGMIWCFHEVFMSHI